LCILAIKLLTERFESYKTEWRLVVAKGKGYLKKTCGLSDATINNGVKNLKVNTLF